MALLARKLGQFFRIVAPQIFRAKISVVLIGQVRTHGIGSFFTYAGLSGGKALEHWMSTCLFLRTGQKADAPMKKEKVPTETPDGIHMKTVKTPIGFDCVIRMDKTKNSTSATENEDIHLPFYFKTGFLNPLEFGIPFEGNKNFIDTKDLKENQTITEFHDHTCPPLEPEKKKETRGRKKGSKNKSKEK